MTQIDFYLLSTAHTLAHGLSSAASSLTSSELASPNTETRLPFLCKLVEKIYRLDKQIYIHCTSQGQAEHISKSLWSTRKESFLAHDIIGNQASSTSPETPSPSSPIEIGYHDSPKYPDVMINLADDIPSFVGRFNRVVELVADDEQTKAKARERYTYYRNRGYTLKTHDLSAAN
ncbi:MAG TPA: DNA polymerase III subunit chi [Pseudomonadales bacterium]